MRISLGTAEAYLRGRQTEDGFSYPGPNGKVVVADLSEEERDAAVALTLRVLVMLRRIN